MRLRQHSSPAGFLERARDFLEKREAENNLLLGISSWLATHPQLIQQPPYFVTVEENETVQAAGMMTPPHNLVLSRAKKEALAAIVEHTANKRIIIPGVNGPWQTSRTYARLWAQEKGCSFQLHRSLRIYQLSRVIAPKRVEGRMRLAAESDAHVLVPWICACGQEIDEPQSQEEASDSFRSLLTDQRLYVWEDKGLCSMAAWSGPTSHGVRINLVYTPTSLRGRGYASACVAALSRSMLESGRTFCYLFTDLSNPTSNKIYQLIGYRPVCDFAEYHFQA